MSSTAPIVQRATVSLVFTRFTSAPSEGVEIVTTSPTAWVNPCPGPWRSFTGANIVPRKSTNPSGYWWFAPIACAARSSGSRLISLIELEPSSMKPSGPATRSARSARRTSSTPKCSSNSRTNGPIAQDPVLSFALERSSALRPSKSRRFTSLPSAAPTTRPAEDTASTISGSGLFHDDCGWMPMSAPVPTADIGCALVKISASGPIPTSRYCDHAFCAISACFTRSASAEPGFAESFSPRIPASAPRTDSAFAASPRACSSITRSSMLDTNVTPAALIACRSLGARSQGFEASRIASSLLASYWPIVPMRSAAAAPRTARTGSARSRSSLVVGATRARSKTAPPRTTTGEGPCRAGSHARPTSVARAASRGSARAGSRSASMSDEGKGKRR